MSCLELSRNHGDAIRRVADVSGVSIGEPITQQMVSNAITLNARGEITSAEADAVQEGFDLGCLVPDPSSRTAPLPDSCSELEQAYGEVLRRVADVTGVPVGNPVTQGMVSNASTLNTRGEITNAERSAVAAAAESGCVVPDPSQPEPDPPDRSIGGATFVEVAPSGPRSFTVEWIAENQITSGDGEMLEVITAIWVDGQQIATPSTTLSPGESKTLRREFTGIEPGRRTVSVGEQSNSKTVTVPSESEPPEPEPPEPEPPEPEPPDESEGATTYVSLEPAGPRGFIAEWINKNQIVSGDGERIDVTTGVWIDGELSATPTVTLGPGESKRTEMEFGDVEPGERTVAVGTTSNTKTVTVPPEPEPPEPDPPEPEPPEPDPPDESDGDATYVSLEPAGPRAFVAEWIAENQIVSGDGERIDVTTGVWIDGELSATPTVTLGPGESKRTEMEFGDVEPGERTVAVGTTSNTKTVTVPPEPEPPEPDPPNPVPSTCSELANTYGDTIRQVADASGVSVGSPVTQGMVSNATTLASRGEITTAASNAVEAAFEAGCVVPSPSGSEPPEPEPPEPDPRSCSDIAQSYGDTLRTIADRSGLSPGSTVTQEMVTNAVTLNNRGEITNAERDAVEAAFEAGCVVPEPENASEMVGELGSLTSPRPGEIRFAWSVRNNPTKGEGVRLATTAVVRINGLVEAEEQVELGPGESESFENLFDGYEGGTTQQVCLRLQEPTKVE